MVVAMRALSLFLISLALTPAQDAAFFEARVRPVLARHCYGCHAAGKQFSGLRVDSREALLRGGRRGPALVPGKPEQSLLVRAIRHEEIAMPMGGQLAPAEVTAIADWVRGGAVWPATPATGKAEGRYARLVREHWAFQPVKRSVPARAGHPVDAFLPAVPASAEPRVLLRRLSYALTGLPPTSEEAERNETHEQAVDRLLASPHFGEQWARHWLDVVRYAETRGYEWNYEIVGAWRYRDYLIRAFNADVPYDQLIREHLAGDLLAKPRLNAAEQINESVIGTAFYRLGEAGHDDCIQFREIALDVIDNQIDTLTKAFQGLTVACARCHDHTLDPIPTVDYYALYGILNSSRPVVRSIDSASVNEAPLVRLETLRGEIRSELVGLWRREASELAPRLLAKKFTATKEMADPATVWAALAAERAGAMEKYRAEATAREAFTKANYEALDAGWVAAGTGVRESAAGELAIMPEGDTIVTAVLPRGVYSGAASQRIAGALRSPDLPKHRKFVSIRAYGGSLAARRAVIDNCAIGEQNKLLEGRVPQWTKVDTYAKEQRLPVFIELVTKAANPRYPDRPGVLKPEQEKLLGASRSYFGFAGAVAHDVEESPKESLASVMRLFSGETPDTPERMAAAFARVIREALEHWADDGDAFWIDWAVQEGLLTNHSSATPALASLLRDYRAAEALLATPRMVEGLADAGAGRDYPVLIAGGPKSFGALAPRRLLQEILGGPALGASGSGRLELAEQIASARNPLTARVMVNRIWHYVFGQGLVASVDNFGTLGDQPSQPALLEYLATRFMDDGWSVKKMIRLLVTSAQFRQAQRPVRRLTAEELRDSILQSAGELKRDLYGESIDPPRAATKDYRRLFAGPLDGGGRRSIYTKITRMEVASFLETFDYPAPQSGRGSRDVTNVPAQALTLLNDPFVVECARRWAARVVGQASTAEARIDAMFRQALGRPAEAAEQARFRRLAAELASLQRADLLTSETVWKDVAHAIFNLKEFLYVR